MSPREENGFASKCPEEMASFLLMGIYYRQAFGTGHTERGTTEVSSASCQLGTMSVWGARDSVETGGCERPDLSLQADAPKKSPRATSPLLAGFAERPGGSTLFLPLRTGIDAASQL